MECISLLERNEKRGRMDWKNGTEDTRRANLEVAMDNGVLVTISDRVQNLPEVEPSFRFRQFPAFG